MISIIQSLLSHLSQFSGYYIKVKGIVSTFKVIFEQCL